MKQKKGLYDFYYSQKIAQRRNYMKCPSINRISYTDAVVHGNNLTTLVDDAILVYTGNIYESTIGEAAYFIGEEPVYMQNNITPLIKDSAVVSEFEKEFEKLKKSKYYYTESEGDQT